MHFLLAEMRFASPKGLTRVAKALRLRRPLTAVQTYTSGGNDFS